MASVRCKRDGCVRKGWARGGERNKACAGSRTKHVEQAVWPATPRRALVPHVGEDPEMDLGPHPANLVDDSGASAPAGQERLGGLLQVAALVGGAAAVNHVDEHVRAAQLL